jgi:hypothetical protein
VQRTIDNVCKQLIAERFHNGGDCQNHLSRTDCGDEPGASKDSQPAQTDLRPGRSETVIDRPRDGVTNDKRGDHLSDRPTGEPDKLIRLPL